MHTLRCACADACVYAPRAWPHAKVLVNALTPIARTCAGSLVCCLHTVMYCPRYNPTPAAALIVQTMAAALLILVLESFETLVRIYVWIQWVFYALTISALVKLR